MLSSQAEQEWREGPLLPGGEGEQLHCVSTASTGFP